MGLDGAQFVAMLLTLLCVCEKDMHDCVDRVPYVDTFRRNFCEGDAGNIDIYKDLDIESSFDASTD